MSRLFCCLKNGESIVIVLFSYLTHSYRIKRSLLKRLQSYHKSIKWKEMNKSTNYFYKRTLLFLSYNVI